MPDAPSDDHRESPDAKLESRSHGSQFDHDHQRPAARGLQRQVRRRVTGLVVAVLSRVIPYLYVAYCWVVWKTSRVQDDLTGPLEAALDRHGRFVGVMWHQEVFTVAWGYRHLNGHTLASIGHFGLIITRMLELCGFTVFRGGSSRKKTRRREVLEDMIQHMEAHPRVPYGITVDGSNGPPFQMKRGACVIARAGRAPVFLCRTWYSRCIQLPTWDRTAIPLPFGRIRLWAVGPYWIEPDAEEAEFESACAHVQAELLELAHVSYQELGPRLDSGAPPGFPPAWRPRWVAGALGLCRGSHDLDPARPPPWASVGERAVLDRGLACAAPLAAVVADLAVL